MPCLLKWHASWRVDATTTAVVSSMWPVVVFLFDLGISIAWVGLLTALRERPVMPIQRAPGSLLGLDGEHVGMITFGISAPIKPLGLGTERDVGARKVQTEKGFTVEAVTAAARRVMEGKPRTISSRAEVVRAWKKRKLSSG